MPVLMKKNRKVVIVPNVSVEDIFCSFIIIFIFVVPCLHKIWVPGCWVDTLIT